MPTRHRFWPLLPSVLATAVLSACAASPDAYHAPKQEIRQELNEAKKAVAKPTASADALSSALLPPLQLDVPRPASKKAEPRFDLVVNNAPAAQVLLGIVAGTPYSMLLPPDLSGTITVNLKNVTVPEALSALKQLYGYEYSLEGNRIFVQAQALQTRVLRVNYLNTQRKGTSDLRVISGSVSDAGSSTDQNGSGGSSTTSSSDQSSMAFESSKVSTTTQSDFWNELSLALRAIVGTKEGRNVVISPQSGVIVVRAMPAELAQVETFLKASQLAIERQVILEAKIIEVELSNSFQTGINWAAFGRSGDNARFTIGSLSPGSAFQRSGAIGANGISGDAGQSIVNAANAAGSMFGMVFRTADFAAVLNFLEEQGTVHVLSSPRIATINNQKAVLKVGTDDYFVTNVSSTTTTGTSTTTTPTVTLRPFFSGISLDVTPQIDEHSNITLHIHPSVSQVRAVTQQLDLGSMGTLKLPLASSQISETDSVVRAGNGQIIALGGLIRQGANNGTSQVPLLGDLPVVGNLFRQKNKEVSKRELVILLRPMVIQSEAGWADEINRIDKRIGGMLGNDQAPASANQ